MKGLGVPAPEAIRPDCLDHASPAMEPFPAGVFFSGQIPWGEKPNFPCKHGKFPVNPAKIHILLTENGATGFPASAAAGCLLRLSFSLSTPLADLSIGHLTASGAFVTKFGSGAVAQLEEHLNGIQGVRGSNPLSSTKIC